MSNKIIIMAGLLMTSFLTVNGQTDKRIIDDAWVYLDNWTSYTQSDTVILMKTWSTSTICVVSFEKGLYSVSDEHSQTKEKGRWVIKRKDQQDLIIIKATNGRVIKFRILSIDNNMLKLRRMV